MSLDPIKQLAGQIAGIGNEQITLQQNISPEDSTGLLQLGIAERLIMFGTLQVVSQYYATDSFIISHPVYGDVSSAVLKISGGYNSGLTSTIITTDW